MPPGFEIKADSGQLKVAITENRADGTVSTREQLVGRTRLRTHPQTVSQGEPPTSSNADGGGKQMQEPQRNHCKGSSLLETVQTSSANVKAPLQLSGSASPKTEYSAGDLIEVLCENTVHLAIILRVHPGGKYDVTYQEDQSVDVNLTVAKHGLKMVKPAQNPLQSAATAATHAGPWTEHSVKGGRMHWFNKQTGNGNDLRESWTAVWSKDYSAYYYWNVDTNETTWDDPVKTAEENSKQPLKRTLLPAKQQLQEPLQDAQKAAVRGKGQAAKRAANDKAMRAEKEALQQKAEAHAQAALSYLDTIKFQFQNTPGVFNTFLDVMKQFKSANIDTLGVVKRVAELFEGHTKLIVGLNTFLPPGFEIKADSGQLKVAITENRADGTVSTREQLVGRTHPQAVSQGEPPRSSDVDGSGKQMLEPPEDELP